MNREDQCAVCKASANERCSRCHVTGYCSREHQKQHWKTHKQDCRPYTVQDNSVLGRYIVASKDIKAGEIIVKDVPLVLGPRQMTAPVCVSCAGSVDGTHSCLLCGWPLCSPECQTVTLHRPECSISKSRGGKVEVTKFFQINEMYECITPLRCLWLRDNEPSKWKQLMAMESHLEERRRSKALELDKSNVIDFVRGYLKYQTFQDEDLYKICGILEVNGIEIPAPNLVGLYGQACLLEHSCIANSARTFDTQMNIIVRATVPIKKGEHITTSYTDPMWGTASRQMHLISSKYFTCNCNRCTDPQELGTHFSSIRCPNCSDLLSPPIPHGKDDWKCGRCRTATPSVEMHRILKNWGEKLANLRGNFIESEDFLSESEKVFGENHHYRVDVKIALGQLMGKQTEEQLTALTELQLKKKETFCLDSLKLADKFCPGLTRLRGLLQFEIAMTRWELYRRLEKTVRTNKNSLESLKEMERMFSSAHECLALESPLQEEHQVALQAQEMATLVNKNIKKCKKKK